MMIFFYTVIPREPFVIARELGTSDRSNLVIAIPVIAKEGGTPD
jgi:hypothetical protein